MPQRGAVGRRLKGMFRRIGVLVLLLAAGCTRDVNGVPRGVACQAPPLRAVWAVAVSGSGRVLWRSQLAPPGAAGMPWGVVSPVAIDRVAVAAEGGQVLGLRLADGRQLWRRAEGEPAGLWRWQDLAVVRADTAGPQVVLAGLDAATGRVRWSMRPRIGRYGAVAATSDGGLAMLTTAGVLQVVGLADGRLHWHAVTGVSPAGSPGGVVLPGGVPVALAAGDGVVVVVAGGRATEYDDRTGRVRWAVDGLPDQPQAQFADGLVLITRAVPGAGQPAALTAIEPGSGRVAWRFAPGVPVQPAGSGPAGLAVLSEGPDGYLYLLAPTTGRPRWRAGSMAGVTEPASLVVTATGIIAMEGTNSFRIVDRSAVDGRVRWMTPPEMAPRLLAPAGPVVIAQDEHSNGTVTPLRAYELASGRLAWKTDLPPVVQDVTSVPGGVLVEAGHLGPALPCGSG